MKRIFTWKKLRNTLLFFCLGLFLLIGGCYEFAYVIQPNVVAPNSTFDVTLCVQPSEEGLRDNFAPSYGCLGIMLPEGWTVEDTIKYTLNMQEPYDTLKSFLFQNDSVSSFLMETKPIPSGYYWWGAKTLEEVSLLTFSEGFVYVKMTAGPVNGEFNVKYVLGDYGNYYKDHPEDLFGIRDSTELLTIKVDQVSAVNSWKNEDWNIYPNPSDGEVFVRLDDLSGEVTMRIYDLNGKLKKSALLRKSLNSVDLSSYPKGTYIISLEKRGEIETKKVIIQ